MRNTRRRSKASTPFPAPLSSRINRQIDRVVFPPAPAQEIPRALNRRGSLGRGGAPFSGAASRQSPSARRRSSSPLRGNPRQTALSNKAVFQSHQAKQRATLRRSACQGQSPAALKQIFPDALRRHRPKPLSVDVSKPTARPAAEVALVVARCPARLVRAFLVNGKMGIGRGTEGGNRGAALRNGGKEIECRCEFCSATSFYYY